MRTYFDSDFQLGAMQDVVGTRHISDAPLLHSDRSHSKLLYYRAIAFSVSVKLRSSNFLITAH